MIKQIHTKTHNSNSKTMSVQRRSLKATPRCSGATRRTLDVSSGITRWLFRDEAVGADDGCNVLKYLRENIESRAPELWRVPACAHSL